MGTPDLGSLSSRLFRATPRIRTPAGRHIVMRSTRTVTGPKSSPPTGTPNATTGADAHPQHESGPYLAPDNPGRHRRMEDSAGGWDYVRVKASGTVSLCAGDAARVGAFWVAIMKGWKLLRVRSEVPIFRCSRLAGWPLLCVHARGVWLLRVAGTATVPAGQRRDGLQVEIVEADQELDRPSDDSDGEWFPGTAPLLRRLAVHAFELSAELR